jgi:hypothetical protein
MMTNNFLEIADRQISAPRKARQRASESRAKQNALADREQQSCLWHKWRQERVDALLAGPHGEAAKKLTAFLDQMTSDDASALIDLVRRGPWCDTDTDTRFLVLALIDHAIVRLRERHNLPTFDDPLPGASPNVFLTIREVLR